MKMDLEYDDYSYSLSVLTKKGRKWKPGRKEPQPGEFVVNVDPAADSNIERRKNKSLVLDDLESQTSLTESDTEELVTACEGGIDTVEINSSDEDEAGIHHYSHLPLDPVPNNDESLSVSGRRSMFSEAETPAEFLFGNVPENIGQVYNALVKTPTYSCLRQKQCLAEDIVNDFISFMIKIHIRQVLSTLW